MDVGKLTLSLPTAPIVTRTERFWARAESCWARERRARETGRIRAQHRLDASLLCTGNREGRHTQQQQDNNSVELVYIHKSTDLNITSASSRAQPERARRTYARTQRQRKQRDGTFAGRTRASTKQRQPLESAKNNGCCALTTQR